MDSLHILHNQMKYILRFFGGDLCTVKAITKAEDQKTSPKSRVVDV